MDGDNPRSTAKVGGHPLHPLVIPFPIVCFIGAFATDLMWMGGRESGWATASDWLVGAGLVTALLAAVTGFIDYRGDARVRRIGAAKRHMIANIAVILLETVSLVLRLTDGTERIAPAQIWLSAISVAILAYSGWLGGELVYRHGIGVRNPEPTPPAGPDRKFSRDRR